MLQNYFKVALRNLRKDKLSSGINIMGLTIGFACIFLILLFVLQEMSVDTAFSKADRIYRVVNDERPFAESGRYLATTSPPFAPALKADFPEVESAVRLRYTDDVILKHQDQQYYEDKVIYADQDFFKLFDFPFQDGDPENALSQPNNVVLTYEQSLKYFGAENPIGKEILMNSAIPLRVTGVLMQKQPKTHLDFDFLISFSTFKVPFGYPVTLDSWGWISFHTYLLLQQGSDPKRFDQRLSEFASEHMYQDRPVRAQFRLQPLSDIYFHSNEMMNTAEHKRGSLTYTYGLLFIALLILIVAGFNFMNISTARSIRRAKEVGMRKVLGAGKLGLVKQFVMESVMVASLGGLFAILLFIWSQSTLMNYLGWDVEFSLQEMYFFLPAYIGLVLLVGLLSSIYPALILTGFDPIQVLKGVVKSNSAELNIRKGLVIAQFVITISLIICSLMVSRQMKFIGNKNLGYDKSHLVSLQMRTDDFLDRYQLAAKILQQNPYVEKVSAGDLIDGDYGSVPVTKSGEENGIAMHMMGGYFDYFSTLDIEFVEGRDFSASHPQDTATGIIVNESAVRSFGWQDPLGQRLQVNTDISGEVIGVVKDFHFFSLHDPIEPLVIVMPRTHLRNIIIRLAPTADMAAVISSLKSDWMKFSPDLPFRFSFLDDQVNARYAVDARFSKLIAFFSILAIFISGLGLYGLIAIMVTYRTKEIGIRKILGASMGEIYVLISKNFILWIIVSNLIAIPLAWWLISHWLNKFSYHIHMDVLLILIAVAVSLTIALFAISLKVIKSALANPIQAIRHN